MKKLHLPLKAIGIVVLMVMMGIRSEGAIKTSAASGNWNVASTWSPAAVPLSGDEVIIANGHTVTLTLATTILNVTINAGGILNIGNIQSLTITGAFTNNGTLTGTSGRIALTGNFTNSGSFTLTTGRLTISTGNFTNNTGGNFTFGAGRLQLSGNFSNAGTLSLAAEMRLSGTATQNIGGFTTTGLVSMQKNGGVATFTGNVNGAALTIDGTGGTLNLGASLTHTFTGVITLTRGTLNGGTSTFNVNATSTTAWGGTATVFVPATGTVNFGGVDQTLSASGTKTFYNLTFSNSGIKTCASTTVNGVLTMEGTATASAAPTYGIDATLKYVGSRTAGVEWITTFAASGGVIINTGTITANAAKVFNETAPLTINSGATLAMGVNLLTLNGNLINNGGTTSGSGGLTITGTATQSIGAFTTTGLVSMTKASGTATLTGNVSGAGLTIGATGTVGSLNLGAGLNHTFTSTWTRTAGTLDGGSSTINFTRTGTVHNGTGGTFTASTGTVNYSRSSAQVVVPLLDYYNLTLSGSGTKTLTDVSTITNNLTLSGTATATAATTLTVSGDVILQSGTFSGGDVTINVGGNWTNNGGAFDPGTSTINFNNTTTGKSINGTAASQTFNNVSLNNSNQTLTAWANLTIVILTSSATSTLDMGTNTLVVTTATASAGKIYTQNTSATPVSSGKTWGGTFIYNGASAQTARAGTYKNLTISTTGGVTASGDITVNGELNLAAANASATKGCLETGTFSITMGGSALTTGTGDVTGVVTREVFLTGIPYTFGNQFTTLNMEAGGTLPSFVSFKIILSTDHSWKPNAIHRYYDIIQVDGDANTKVTVSLHYLNSELNDAVEGDLDMYDYHFPDIHNHGHSSFNTTNNWVERSTMSLTYLAPSEFFDIKYWMLGTSDITHKTWLGAAGTDWIESGNWTGGVPGPTDHVVIPVATSTLNDPTLPAATTINDITIETGGILNGGTGSLTLNGASGAWLNLGTFNGETSTVIFTNANASYADPTNFYNVTIADAASLTLGSGSTIRIAGTLLLSGSGVLNAGSNESTVEYNGSGAQTVINPNGSTPGYHNLILNNTGTISLPSTKLYIRGDWTNNMSGITATNVEFNGPYSMVQNIKGSQTTTFTTLTINNNAGVVLTNVDLKVNTSLVLTSGVITTGNNTVIINAGGSVTRDGTTSIGWVNGNLQRKVVEGDNFFYIGTSVYAPASFYMLNLSGNVVLTAKATNGNPAAGSGINQAAKCNHYWTVTKSDIGTFDYYNLILNFTNTTNTGVTNNYKLRKHSSEWEIIDASVPDGSKLILANNLKSFSDYEVGELNSLIVSSQPSNSSICIGTNTSFTAVSTSLPAPTVRWQRSTDAINFIDIDGSIDGGIYSNFTTTTLNINGATTAVTGYTYKAVFTNVNGNVSSSIVSLTVSPTSVGGTLTGGTTLCAGTNSTTLTLGSNVGTVAKWQYTTNGGANWTDISNTADSYTAENVNITTIYRAVVQSGLCSSANSTEQTITVTANSWTGNTSTAWEIADNWTCGVPTAGTNVIIPFNKTVVITTSSSASPAQCNTLTIEAGGVLMINAGKALTVNGNLTNNAGLTGLVIKSDENGTGSLIENSGATAKVERYIANNFKWHFLSSPVNSQAIWPAFAPAPTGNPLTYGEGPDYNWDFYYYNPNALVATQLYWVNLRKDATGAYNDGTDMLTGSDAGYGAAVPAFVTGRGYLTAYNAGWNLVTGSPTTHNFTGSLNAGTVSHDISFIDGNSYNLMGNPYPSSIDWKAAGWSRSTLTPSTEGYDFWIYNDGTGNYGTYNNSSSTGTNGVTQYIAPGQAFFVKAASSGSLGMTDAIRVHSTQAFLKNTNAETNLVRLKIENTANTYSDEMIVEFNADFSGGGSDKFWSFYTVAPEIYSVKDGNNYSIDRYNTLTDDMKVDIAAKTGVAATYTITATNIADFTLRDKVYLLDKKTGVKTNLKQTPSYSFAGTPDDDRNRFQLIFGTSIGVDEETNSDITIYASENIIYVRNDKANEPYTVMVSNMLGQIITRTKLAGNTLNQIELKRVPGVYVVTVYSEGSLFSKKVVVK